MWIVAYQHGQMTPQQSLRSLPSSCLRLCLNNFLIIVLPTWADDKTCRWWHFWHHDFCGTRPRLLRAALVWDEEWLSLTWVLELVFIGMLRGISLAAVCMFSGNSGIPGKTSRTSRVKITESCTQQVQHESTIPHSIYAASLNVSSQTYLSRPTGPWTKKIACHELKTNRQRTKISINVSTNHSDASPIYFRTNYVGRVVFCGAFHFNKNIYLNMFARKRLLKLHTNCVPTNNVSLNTACTIFIHLPTFTYLQISKNVLIAMNVMIFLTPNCSFFTYLCWEARTDYFEQ